MADGIFRPKHVRAASGLSRTTHLASLAARRLPQRRAHRLTDRGCRGEGTRRMARAGRRGVVREPLSAACNPPSPRQGMRRGCLVAGDPVPKSRDVRDGDQLDRRARGRSAKGPPQPRTEALTQRSLDREDAQFRRCGEIGPHFVAHGSRVVAKGLRRDPPAREQKPSASAWKLDRGAKLLAGVTAVGPNKPQA